MNLSIQRHNPHSKEGKMQFILESNNSGHGLGMQIQVTSTPCPHEETVSGSLYSNRTRSSINEGTWNYQVGR